jgi:hypothetical protein
MRIKSLVPAVLLPVLLCTRLAAAAEPADQPAPAPSGLQFAAGALVALGGTVVGFQLGSGVGLASLALTPAAVGAAVCGVGALSKESESSCVGTITAAYLGALSAIPLGYLGFHLDYGHGHGEYLDGLGGFVIGAGIGLFVLQPLAATLAWRLMRTPRRPVLALAPPAASRSSLALRGYERRSAPVPGQVTVTALAVPF